MGMFREWLRRKGFIRRMAPYKRSDVVRMFPEYGNDGVLWYAGGASYEGSGLDPALITELRAWEAAYFDGLEDELEWRSRALEKAHRAEGVRLARKVAAALGSAFAVDLDGKKFRSDCPPDTPAAARAFTLLADEEEARYEEIARLVADGAELSWSAYPPEPRDDQD